MAARPRDFVRRGSGYVPGGPLFAHRVMTFRGVAYAVGAALPVAEMSPAKHRAMVTSRYAGAEPKRRKARAVAPPAPTAPPAAPVQPDTFTAGGVIEIPTEPNAPQVVAFKITEQGPTVDVETPAQQRAKFKRR